jgi:hypothetical protein
MTGWYELPVPAIAGLKFLRSCELVEERAAA